jgi:hypothetical protein
MLPFYVLLGDMRSYLLWCLYMWVFYIYLFLYFLVFYRCLSQGRLYHPVSKLMHNLKRGGYHKITDNKTVPKLYLQMLHTAVQTGPHLIGGNNMSIANV